MSACKESTAEQTLHRADEAVGALADTIIRAGTDRHITIDGGATAESVIGGTIGQVDLLDIADRGKILGTLEHFDHTGAALSDSSTIVEVVETFVGIHPS